MCDQQAAHAVAKAGVGRNASNEANLFWDSGLLRRTFDDVPAENNKKYKYNNIS